SFISTVSIPETQTSYYVSPGDTTLFGENVFYSFQDSGMYSVLQTIVDTNGCRADSLRNIRIKPVSRFFIPNTFSPNADGINDVFMVKGTGLNDFHLEIFNRWGE